MDHAGADFHAGGEAVEDKASGSVFHEFGEVAVVGELGIGAVQAGGELAVKEAPQI